MERIYVGFIPAVIETFENYVSAVKEYISAEK